MKEKMMIAIILCVLAVVFLPTVSIAQPVETDQQTSALDPGGITGFIFGRVRDPEFVGPYNENLAFYAVSVWYFGVGHAFDAGFYPRHWARRDITCFYCNFRGSFTHNIIVGVIDGLPGQ